MGDHMDEELDYYVLFPNHENGLKLYSTLKRENIRTTITPAPRQASICCGISLLVDKKDLQAVELCVKRDKIEIDKIVALPKNKIALDRFC